MIDPELKTHLERIEKELVEFRRASLGVRATLIRGVVYGVGYILGAVLVIVLVGWFLNIIGVIPAFSDQVREFQTALERIGGKMK